MGPLARQEVELLTIKERALLQGSGSVSGSPGRLHDNVSRDSGVGGLNKDGLNTSGESEHDIPKFINDNNDKTSYLRGKFLGKGGFARVHELIDLSTNCVVAGKIIHKSRVCKPHHKEKISREIELHRSLRHKNVVQFIKHFEDSENIYIVLENCARKSLVHVLKARHVVTEPETRYYMSQLVHGVDYIHSQNIIHRDLKLGNLFLTNSMAVKIGDFGLATRLGQEKKGTICGTPNYISPEVLNKEGHGFQADVWALGCVMYALLVGQPPFETSTLKETYSRIAENHYTVPDTVSVPAAVLIRHLLHPHPRGRPLVRTILQDPFFAAGYFPPQLPVSCCTTPPVFQATPAAPHHHSYHYNSNHNNVFQSADNISQLTSSVHNLALPDKSSPPATMVPSPATSPMIQSPLPPSTTQPTAFFRGGSGSLADLPSAATANQLLQPPVGKSVTRSPQLHHLQQQHTVVGLLSGAGNGVSVCGAAPQQPRGRAASMYEALVSALDMMPARCLEPLLVPTTRDCPVFITKWIDYSNKYGFGFQLSDRSVGVLFNDTTRISFSSDRSFIQFGEGAHCSTLSTHQVPAALQEKFTLLRYFAQYMDENLTEGGEVTCRPPARPLLFNNRAASIPQIRRWIRTPKAIVMHLTNSTLQVNYFKDHTKLIVGCLDNRQNQHIVTFINSERQSRSWYLADLARRGATSQVRERIAYMASVLEEFAELDFKQI